MQYTDIPGGGIAAERGIKEKQMEKQQRRQILKEQKGQEEKEQERVQQEISCGCSHKTKERSDKEYQDLMNRLKRIEGQVRGIQGMLQKDAYCADVLVQVAAVNAALNSFNKALLANHVRTCVADNIRAGNDEIIDELVILLQKLMK